MGTIITAANKTQIEEVINLFIANTDAKESSRNLYKRTLKQFFNWVEETGRDIKYLTRADILIYRDDLINLYGKSTLTAASYLTSVKLFYKWAESERLSNNIASGVKLPKRNKKFEKEPLTTEQAKDLITEVTINASYKEAAIINLLLRTGLRTIEVVRANIGDLQYKSGQLVLLVQGKGRDSKDNFVIISNKCRAALMLYLNTRNNPQPDEPLFTSSSRRNTGERMTTRSISRIAKNHLKEIGLNSRSHTAHSLRHTCACRLIMAGVPDTMVQMTLRHATPATTQMYIYHVEEQRRLEAAVENKLDNIF